ncbi:alanine racemase [Patescibacteria group bacterium]
MKIHPITRVEVSEAAIKHNIRMFQRILRTTGTNFMAVVKSNAYGHGMVEVARIAQKHGIRWFGVVNLDEALVLRKNGVWARILVLSYFTDDGITQAIKQNITLSIYNLNDARKISRIAKSIKRIARVHFKVDTGTSRLGIRSKEAITMIRQITLLKYIHLEGIFTHFSDSENPNQYITNRQIKEFDSIILKLENEGITFSIKHAACSASTLLNKKTHYNLSRIGISLYGLHSIEKDGMTVRKKYPWFSLQPALSWKTHIIQIKNIKRNTCVGYGCDYRAKKKIRIAILPVGYWDGYDRKLSNKGSVIICGKRAKIVGRICMNLSMVDITNIQDAKIGNEAILIGKKERGEVTADEVASLVQTINYEVVTRINPLIHRKVI